MDQDVIQAIFSIRDSLIEMRDAMRLQKNAYERATRESNTAKETLAKLMAMLPPNVRATMEPLTKMGV